MRTFGLVCWCLLAWVLLTWTATTEVLVTGLTVAVVCAVALTPLGPVAPPWRALRPSRTVPLLRLAGTLAVRMVRANVVMAAPVHRQRQQPSLLHVRRAAGRDDRVQHRRRVQVPHVGGLGLVERGAGHTRNLDATTDTHRRRKSENRVVHKGNP